MTPPVTFAPGRLRLATRPNATGSAPVAKTIGMVVVAAFAASAAGAGRQCPAFSMVGNRLWRMPRLLEDARRAIAVAKGGAA
jgi:hypothetical protein